MQKRTFNSAGKIASASLAIVLASCLIFQEQNQKNPASSTPPTENPPVAVEANAAETENQNLVQSIHFQTNSEASMDISTMSIYDLDSFLADVNMSRTNPIFFATSKAGPPPAVNNTYTIHIKKGDPSNPQTETVNLSKIEEKAWSEISTKLKTFYLAQTTSSIILVHNDSKTELRGLNKQQIEEALLKIDGSKIDMTALSTSKSLAPATIQKPTGYQLEITPKTGEKSSWQTQRDVLIGLADPNIYMDYSKAGELVHEDSPFGIGTP